MATGEELDFGILEQLLGVELKQRAGTGKPEHGLVATLHRGGRQMGKLKFRRNADVDRHTTDMVRWLCEKGGDLTNLGLGEEEEINFSVFREQEWSFCAVERSGLLQLVQQVWERNMARLSLPSPSSSEDGSEGSEPGSDGGGSESGFEGEMANLTPPQRAALWIIARNIALQLDVEDAALVWDRNAKKRNGPVQDDLGTKFLEGVKALLTPGGVLDFILERNNLEATTVDSASVAWIEGTEFQTALDEEDPDDQAMFFLTQAAASVVNSWEQADFIEKAEILCLARESFEAKLKTLVKDAKIRKWFAEMNFKDSQAGILQMCHRVLFPEDRGEFGASGSGLHGANLPHGSSGESGEPEWLTKHKEAFLAMGNRERVGLYGTALAIAGSTVLRHTSAEDFALEPEKEKEVGPEAKGFFGLLKMCIKDMFPGGLSLAIATAGYRPDRPNTRCLLTRYSVGTEGPRDVRKLSPKDRADIVLDAANVDILFQEESMIATETDPFFDYMAWPQERKESEWFCNGQLDWHLVVMAIVFVLLELGDGFDPQQIIDPEVLEGVETITISRNEGESPGNSPQPVTPKRTPRGKSKGGGFSSDEEDEEGDGEGGVKSWRCSVM